MDGKAPSPQLSVAMLSPPAPAVATSGTGEAFIFNRGLLSAVRTAIVFRRLTSGSAVRRHLHCYKKNPTVSPQSVLRKPLVLAQE
jgi:hypothetical protein